VARRVSIVVQQEDDEDIEDVDPTGVESPKTHRPIPSLAKEHVSESHSLQRRDSISSESATVSRVDVARESLHDRSHSSLLTGVEEEEQPLLDGDSLDSEQGEQPIEPVVGEALTRAEHVRGEVFGVLGICLIAFAWVLFLWTALLRLRSKEEREGGST